MLDKLIYINPSLYNELVELLKKECRLAEAKYNGSPNSYGFRFFQSNDPNLGGNYDDYTTFLESGIESHLFNSEELRIPISETWVYFGWVCKNDLGTQGTLKIRKNGVTIRNINASMVYENQFPKHMYFDFQHIEMFCENTLVEILIRNEFDFSIKAEVYPILYRISEKGRLMSGNNSELENVIDYSKIPENIDKYTSENLNREKLNKIEYLLKNINAMYEPFKKVEIKDTPFSSHIELKPRIDPFTKQYLESLENKKLCEFCMEPVGQNNFCPNCGVPIDYSKEKETLHIKLNKN